MIRIITDSTSDLGSELLTKLNIFFILSPINNTTIYNNYSY